MGDSAGELVVEISGRDVNLTSFLERMQAQLEKAEQTGKKTGDGIGKGVGDGAQKGATGALAMQQALARLELQQAKLAQAQGNTARAAELEAQAEQRLTSAIAAQEKTTIQAVNAQRQLAQVQTQAAGGAGGLNSVAQQLGGSLGALASAAGPVAAAMVGLKVAQQVGDFAVLGGQVDQTRGSFDKLAVQMHTTGDALLSSLQKASHGEISDMNLQLAASRAQILGVAKSTGEFSTLLDIARDRAQKLGLDTGKAFDDLVTGLGRGSPLILDNLGIMVSAGEANKKYAESVGKTVSQLTAQEQKQALINAVIAQGRETIAATGGAAETTAATYARLGAAWENAKNNLASLVGQGLEPAARGLARLLEGGAGIDQMLAGLSSSIQQGGNATAYIAQAFGITAQSAEYARGVLEQFGITTSEAAAAWTAGGGASLALAGALDMDRVSATAATQATQDATTASDGNTQSLGQQLQKAQESAQATSQLNQAQATLAQLGGQVASGLATANAAAIDLSRAYGIAYTEAYKLIQAQAALAQSKVNAAALSDQRAGERSGGTFSTQAEVTLAANAGRARAKAADDAAAAEARYQKAVGNTGPALSRARSELAGLVKGSAAYYDKLTEIEGLEDGGKKKGKGKKASTKLSDQQKLNNSLIADKEKFEDQYEDLDLKHAQARLKIQQDFAEKMRDAQRDFDQDQLDGRADFYDTLGSVESAKIRKAASAAYEQASVEAGRIAQEKGADVADKYMAAQEKIIADRAKRAAEIEKAEKGDKNGKGKNKDEAEYLKGTDALHRAAEEAKLARIKEGEGSIAAQREKALQDEGRSYEEQQGKIAEASDRSATRREAAALRAGKAVDIELTKVAALGAAYDKVAPQGAPSVTSSASPSATPSASTPASAAPAASTPGADLLAGLDAIKDAVGKVERAVRESGTGVEGAVRGLAGRFAT